MTPIDVVPLFAGERAALLALLADLSTSEWAAPTICTGWSVRDIAAHLLGDDVGFVSRWRDGVVNPEFGDGLDISTWDGLIAAIDRQNAEWVRATRRVSPPLLIELLRDVGDQFVDLVTGLDPDELAGPVDWAGPGPAPTWLHVVREYTERWVHQQQIRDAVGRPGLTERRWMGPVLEGFALAVPRALSRASARPGAAVRLVIDGDAGGTWTFVRGSEGWAAGEATAPDAEVRMDADTAWRLYTKGLSRDDARRRVVTTGDPGLGAAVLGTVAILA